MMALILFLAQAQDPEVEALVSRLDHDDAEVREKAADELIGRGPGVVPRILSLHRSTGSSEIRLRAEAILRRFPFDTFVRMGPEEPFRQTLKGILLGDLETHRAIPGCWLSKEKQPTIDGSRLTILWQTGAGHGQFLAIVRITSGDGGRLEVRRIAYQGTTPYRSEVKAEGVRVEVTRFDREESSALVGLLQECVSLQPKCARPQDPGKHWASSGSFSLRYRIDSGGVLVWSAAYTGSAGSAGEPDYSHGWLLDQVFWRALAGRAWTEDKISGEDRARALQWMGDHFASEGWWVKEHYLDMARFIGDESYRPFLETVAKGLEGRDGPSEKRQLGAVQDALSRIPRAQK